MATAGDVYRMVRDRLVWVPGYDGYRQLATVDSKGDAIGGASTVWGSPKSPVRCMTYDKAAEDHWEDTVAVRHEVRLGKATAATYFADLLKALRAASTPDLPRVEARFVQSVLAKKMTYKDTSRLARLASKAEWPDNWARDSKAAAFWDQVVSGEVMELAQVHRATADLEKAYANCVHQYARKLAMRHFQQVYGEGRDWAAAADDILRDGVLRITDQDLVSLLRMVPAENHERLVSDLEAFRNASAYLLEQMERPENDE